MPGAVRVRQRPAASSRRRHGRGTHEPARRDVRRRGVPTHRPRRPRRRDGRRRARARVLERRRPRPHDGGGQLRHAGEPGSPRDGRGCHRDGSGAVRLRRRHRASAHDHPRRPLAARRAGAARGSQRSRGSRRARRGGLSPMLPTVVPIDRRADRYDVLCASALAALTILSRMPYRARMLYNWDAVQFALALREYDVVKHQPHPPGYILYVALGRLVNTWLDDPTSAYVVLAVAFSGLTTFVVYMLARTAYDRVTALVAATLLAVSPLSWFYGSVGLTYAGEALCASTVAYFGFRALRGSETDAWLAAGYLGLAGGVRQSILLLLLPLWLGATIIGVRRLRTVVVGFLIIAVAVTAWFVPLLWLTGGFERYLAASVDLAETVVKPTSILGGYVETNLRMARYLVESVLVGLGPLALAVCFVPWYVRHRGWGSREWFFAGWTITPV